MRNIKALREVGRQIGIALGTFWSLDEDDDSTYCVYIRGQEGATIVIRPTGYKYDPNGRLVISGRYPHCPTWFDYDDKHITVAATKDALTITKDIRRRFLPQYLRVYGEVLERKREYEERELLRQQHLQELARVLGTEARNNRVYIPGDIYGSCEARSDTVDFNISGVPFETALKIAALLVGKE